MTTLLLEYSRIPKTVSYSAVIKIGTSNDESRELDCSLTLREMTGISLETVIEALHNCMNEKPHERVFIIQTAYQERSERLPKMYELGDTLKDLIKNDLPKAQAAFAPITDWKGKRHEQST